jgi:serine/threonine protein phosphatase PrpC
LRRAVSWYTYTAVICVQPILAFTVVAANQDESGCTCVSAIITPTHVVCANVGDSRCIVGSTRTGATVALTEDHKPSLPEEKIRIEKAGGFVRDDRVNGELAMSRALGDFRYKRDEKLQAHEYPVICYADVAVHRRSGKGDEVLVLACDGVFDVMENSEVSSLRRGIIAIIHVAAMLTQCAAVQWGESL